MASFIKVEVSKDLLKRMEAEAEAREAEDPAAFLAFLAEYALNRMDVLAKHAAKVARVKAAKLAGKAVPKGVTFKRYVPAFTDAKLDEEGTEREVAAWTHKAPAHATPVRATKPAKREMTKRLPDPTPAVKAAPPVVHRKSAAAV